MNAVPPLVALSVVLALVPRAIVAGSEDGADRHDEAVAEIERLGGKVVEKNSESGEPYAEVNLRGPAWKGGDDDLRHLKSIVALRSVRFLNVAGLTDRGLGQLGTLTGLELLRLSGTRASDAGLVHLRGLTHLKFLGLSSKGFTDRSLEYVPNWPDLQSLRLDSAQITDEGLTILERSGRVPALELLSLAGTRVGDRGLAPLAGAQHLKRLFLRATQVSDAGLRHLKGLSRLEALTLSDTQVSDAGLENLAGLSSLTLLHLRNTRVTNGGLDELRNLTALESLDLGGTAVSDAGLDTLRKMGNIRTLLLDGSQLSYEGHSEIQRALPGARIVWQRKSPVRPGERAPELSLDEWLGVPDGTPSPTSKSLKGSPLVLEFWATWCPACRRAIPHLNELSRQFAAERVRFIAITAEKRLTVERFLKRQSLDAWVGLDLDRSTIAAYGIREYPTTVVVDAGGTVRLVTHPMSLKKTTLAELLSPSGDGK